MKLQLLMIFLFFTPVATFSQHLDLKAIDKEISNFFMSQKIDFEYIGSSISKSDIFKTYFIDKKILKNKNEINVTDKLDKYTLENITVKFNIEVFFNNDRSEYRYYTFHLNLVNKIFFAYYTATPYRYVHY